MVEGDPAAANVSAEAATTDVAKEGGAERRPPRIKSRLLDRISDLSKAKA
jgi:hypothetical protein